MRQTSTMPHASSFRARRRGAALVFAIGILGIFSVLAMGYVRGASLTIDNADFVVRKARARAISAGGVNAAIGNLHKLVLNGRTGDGLGTATYDLPTYNRVIEGDNPSLQMLENRKAEAVVSVSDESGKVNLNHAPASVLQAVLGVEGATARNITSSLPPAGASGQWLACPEDLLSRQLLTQQQYAAVDASLITTYTVPDHAHAEKYLNLNQSSPKVWSALFGVPLEVAQQAYDKRPFTSLDGLLTALGKMPAPTPPPATETPPADPNATVDPAAVPAAAPPAPAPAPEPPLPAAVTSAVAFESRTFRILSEGSYVNTATKYTGPEARARVEAVVHFDDNGNYTVVYWSENGPEAAQAPA